MLQISDLGLTPRQYSEVQEADESLVEVWLEAVSAPGVSNPTAWFLTGLRTGQPPQHASSSSERAHVVGIAERWVSRVGIFYVSEDTVLAELFDRNGILRHHADDEALRERMAALWRKNRPIAIEVEQEQLERAGRNAATYRALRERRKA